MTSKIDRASGLTPSEKILAELADHTFLDLWSWPNVYKAPGKELCDLLVICGDDVVIFSDKSAEWPPGNTKVAWSRWYRRAIGKSVDQIRGAARWLQNNPHDIYADARCSQRVPLELPPPKRRRVHGICVALGAEKAASTYFQDPDGTFIIFPHLKGDNHVNFSAVDHRPFAIGDVDPAGPFVHVFNQLTLSLVMSELDTITDFTAYLTAREELIRSGKLMFSPSEMEMLANYVQTMRDGRHAFPRPEDLGAPADVTLAFSQGEYAALVISPEYRRRQEANLESYAWDRTIRLFTENVLQGTSYRILEVAPDIQRAERALRIMAREGRLRRRVLGHALVDAMSALEQQKKGRLARIAMPTANSTDPKLAYVFMVLSGQKQSDYETYRKVRASMLETYCLATLHDHRELEMCVGLAVNALSGEGSSEDLIAIEQLDWTTEEVEYLRQTRKHYEILLAPLRLAQSAIFMTEFPPDPALAGMSRQQHRAMERALRKEARRRR